MVISTPEKERAFADLHRISVSLDRIADALEDIAVEAKRPREAAMEQQRRRQAAAAGRTLSTLSSGRGRGEVVEDQSGGEV